MHTLAGDAIEIDRQRRRQGLAFTRLHLSDPAQVKGGTTDELDVIVTLTQHPGGRLAGHGERLDQKIVGLLAIVEALAELARLGPERIVRQRLQFGLGALMSGTSACRAFSFRPSPLRRTREKMLIVPITHRRVTPTLGRDPGRTDPSKHPDTRGIGLGGVSRLRR